MDNGDGTITDNVTGLQWEKKVAGSACVHCVDNFYDWFGARESFIPAVNDSAPCDATGCPGPVRGLGGYNDWRLPTVAELQTIVDLTVPGCGVGSPCIDPIFGPTADATAADVYWSSTTLAGNSSRVWYVNFFVGLVFDDDKTSSCRVRAVRGGR